MRVHSESWGRLFFGVIVCAMIGAQAPAKPSPPVHPVCLAANLAILEITEDLDEKESAPNLCETSPSELSPQESSDIQSVGSALKDVHARLQTLFGADASALFGAGLKLRITRTRDKLLLDNYSEYLDRITLYAPSGSSTLVHKGIYVHEVMHNLVLRRAAGIPAVFHGSFSDFLLHEGLPDLVVSAIGLDLRAHQELGRCAEMRDVVGATYSAVEGAFQVPMKAHDQVQCCREHGSDLPELGRRYCQSLEVPQDEISRQALSIDRLRSSRDLFSPHQLGLPIQNFARSVGESIGENGARLLIDGLRRAEPASAACRLRGDTQGALTVEVQTYRLDRALAELHSRLSGAGIRAFRRAAQLARILYEQPDYQRRLEAIGLSCSGVFVDEPPSGLQGRLSACVVTCGELSQM